MTGLIGWWPLNERSGQARDLSGNGNHGTVNGGITRGIAGKQGIAAYSFDGSDDWIQGPSDFAVSSSFTITGWMRVRSGATNNATIIETNYKNSNGDKIGLALRAIDDNGHFRANGFVWDQSISESDDRSDVYGSSHVDDDNWHHYALVYNGNNGETELFVDGKIDDTDSRAANFNFDLTDSSNPSPAYLTLGRRYSYNDDSSTYLNGKLCDIRIYNRALTSSEVQTLYQQGSQDYTQPRYHNGRDTGAVSRWKFNGDVTDSWGSNDGTDNTSAGYTSNAIRGEAKKFDGTDDYIDTGSWIPNSTLTISAWLNFNTLPQPNDTGTIFSWYTDGSGNEEGITFNTEFQGDSIRLFTRDGSGNDYTVTGATNLSTNEWYHCAATLENSKVRLYVNGCFDGKGTVTQPPWDATPVAWIGRQDLQNNDYWFDGQIDDLRIYNRALKPYEVFQLYQHGTRGKDLRKTIVNQRG